MTPSTEAPANKPFTVIGFWDDSDTAIAVGVVEGTPGFAGSPTVSTGGAWAIDIEAASYEEAEAIGVKQMQDDFDSKHDADEDEDEDEDEDGDEEGDEESSMLFEFERNGVTYEVDFQGETYALYDQDGNAHIADFDYSGDREDHYSIEDAAVRALEAIGR